MPFYNNKINKLKPFCLLDTSWNRVLWTTSPRKLKLILEGGVENL